MTENIIKPEQGYVDDIITNFTYKTIDFWNNIGFTPNMITTLGLISSLSCVYFVCKRNIVLALVFLVLRCYFDYADGLLARKYNKVSKFGDYYDHITDVFGFTIPLIIVLLYSKNNYIYVPILLVFIYCTIVQVGIQEIAHEEKTQEQNTSLDLSKSIAKYCPLSKDFTKYVDNGVLYIVIIIIILFVCNEKN